MKLLMRLLQNFTIAYGHADDTGTHVYSGRGKGLYSVHTLSGFWKEMILTGILCGGGAKR